MTTRTARGTFDVHRVPTDGEADGRIARADLTKTFTGDVIGTSQGLMLSAGDPRTGSAGYVAMEIVDARHGDLAGAFALQQSGLMHNGDQSLDYLVVPGSGSGGFTGMTGTLTLTIDSGTHHYVLEYALPA